MHNVLVSSYPAIHSVSPPMGPHDHVQALNSAKLWKFSLTEHLEGETLAN